jgi:predicted metal-dependent peptidase
MTTTTTARKTEPVKFDAKVDNEIREKLVTARISLLLRAPFFGNLATRLDLVNADDWCPTAATDGRKFYYNTKFIGLLTPKETQFLFGHEILHVVYDHMGRRGDRDPQLWNIADDYCVNADLIEQRIGERINKVPILYDAKYQGMSAEEVYDDLMQNVKKISVEQLAKMLLDDHLDGEDGDGESDGDETGDKDGKGRPRLSREERKAIRDEIKEAVIQAAQSCGAGNLPSGVKRLIDFMTTPKMNWRELIRQQIESTFKSDFTWMRPSRRGWHMDAVMPGMKPGEMIDVCVAIDTSGSISEEQARDFLSEVQGIMQQFEEYRIHVWCFDTDVHNPQVFSSDDARDVAEYQIAGGGGTLFECNWEFMKNENIEPKKFIMFTDMMPGGHWCTPGDENYCDVIFVSHSNGSKITAPFGVTVQYDESI